MAELYLFIIILCTVYYYIVTIVESQATLYICPLFMCIDSMTRDIPHWVTILYLSYNNLGEPTAVLNNQAKN